LYDNSLGIPYQDYREQSELHQTRARTDSSEARQLRRSELAGIRFEHLQPHALGITIMLPKSKTDQEGQEGESRSRVAAISSICRCPNAPARSGRSSSGCARPASRAGRSSARSTVGGNVQKATLNPASVAWILKRALGRAGVRDLHRYGAHSLRAGFATTVFVAE
jgi:integrase